MIFDGITINKKNLSNYIIQQHIMRYIFAAKYVSGKIVLDVACGSGYGTNYLGFKGAKKVYGVDLDEIPLNLAREHYGRSNVKFMQGDILKLPFSDKFFDVVISFETIEHLRQTNQYLAEIKRVLKNNGIFICSTPNIKYTQHPDFHVHEFRPDEFYNLLKENFSCSKNYGQYITAQDRRRDILNRIKKKIKFLKRIILKIIPYNFKQRIKKIIKKQPEKINKEKKTEFLKIQEISISKMNLYSVVPFSSKKLLRIMVAVCQK